MIKNIVLNIPHSSDYLCDIDSWDKDISEDVLKWTDTATDLLFHSNDKRVNEVICLYNRFSVDVERLENDVLEEVGQGILYTDFNGKHRTIGEKTREKLMAYYHRHIKSLSDRIIDENTLVIDCHSFPRDLSDIDICVGFNEDWSKPSNEVLDTIVKHFEELGYKVGINEPYSNSISPKKDFAYQSVMIEVNKRVYLNEENKITPFLYKENQKFQNLYKKLFMLKIE